MESLIRHTNKLKIKETKFILSNNKANKFTNKKRNKIIYCNKTKEIYEFTVGWDLPTINEFNIKLLKILFASKETRHNLSLKIESKNMSTCFKKYLEKIHLKTLCFSNYLNWCNARWMEKMFVFSLTVRLEVARRIQWLGF